MQADLERLLARLLTDPQARAAFLADPAAISEREGLSAQEREAVLSISRQDLATAARSYQRKRAGMPKPRSLLARLFRRLM